MADKPRNMAASVRARLLDIARRRQLDNNLLLTRYAHERLLYRLSMSDHRDRFALKGAMLVATWFENPYRPTRDVDLLGFGDPDAEAMLRLFREICALDIDDGVVFDNDALIVDQIREDLAYGGLRIRTRARIAGASIAIVIDIGFGDAVEPGLETLDLPVLLDQPSPRLKAYAPETVIAEKFQAMVALGRANSRMKDFYDIWSLSRLHAFEGDRLARAIAATFARRDTPIPTEPPDALTAAFAEDVSKQRQWRAFLDGIEVAAPPLADVTSTIREFIMPHVKALGGST
ncbi:MAG: nucleotidyl transferase AbiEii/AbiGii toxin family protein [Reyranellaceae bacterium]